MQKFFGIMIGLAAHRSALLELEISQIIDEATIIIAVTKIERKYSKKIKKVEK